MDAGTTVSPNLNLKPILCSSFLFSVGDDRDGGNASDKTDERISPDLNNNDYACAAALGNSDYGAHDSDLCCTNMLPTRTH